MIPELQGNGCVFLQSFPVEGVCLQPVHGVCPEVTHEEADYRVGEQVQAGSVGYGRQSQLVENVADHHRIQVRTVGGDKDGCAQLLKAPDGLDVALNDQLSIHRGQALETGEELQWRKAVEQGGKSHGNGFCGHAIDQWIEVPGNLLSVPLQHLLEQALLFAQRGSWKLPANVRVKGPVLTSPARILLLPDALPFVVERLVYDLGYRLSARGCNSEPAVEYPGGHFRAD